MGSRLRCYACWRVRHYSWRKKNPDKEHNWKTKPEAYTVYRRRYELRRKFGLTFDCYENLLASQGGGCAICGAKPEEEKSGKSMPVDHCHETGAIRGILCSACNMGIGQFDDDQGRLFKAILYLVKNSKTA